MACPFDAPPKPHARSDRPRPLHFRPMGGKPPTSAVLVSGRTRMIGSPFVARRAPLSGSKAARPTAIPEDAPVPRATASPASMSRLLTTLRKSTPLRRCKASAGVISPALTRSIAHRTAACGVRFASRVCKNHNLPLSIVNSTSCMSRNSCSRRVSAARNCVATAGSERAIASSVSGLCLPDTTSSP